MPGSAPAYLCIRNLRFDFDKLRQLLTGVHVRNDSPLSDRCAAAFQKWRILPFDRTLNGIRTLLQNRRFLILDMASLTATNVAIHPHKQRSAAMAHVAIHAQYDSRAFAPVRRGISVKNRLLETASAIRSWYIEL